MIANEITASFAQCGLANPHCYSRWIDQSNGSNWRTVEERTAYIYEKVKVNLLLNKLQEENDYE